MNDFEKLKDIANKMGLNAREFADALYKAYTNMHAPNFPKTRQTSKANPKPLFAKDPNEVFKKGRKKWKIE